MPADNSPHTPATDTTSGPDLRRQQLERWLGDSVGISGPGVAASSDASFRRYFRYPYNGKTAVAMDAPPATEDCRPFVKVAELLAAAGVTVPQILARDLEQGFLLLSDLGSQTYLEYMNGPEFVPEQADALFTRAIDALIKFQCSSRAGVLPDYDGALLRRELELFPQWYLQRHLQLPLSDDVNAILAALFRQLIEQVSGQSRVFVHRDYMPRNLMVMRDDVGVLDFQDAVYGPISYDPICLFKDAFISWPEQQVENWLRQYWRQGLDAGLPLPGEFADFLRDCDFMGVQRHLKVIGIFARICHRDGKPRYLEDVPRFFDYLGTVARRRPELAALQQLLDWLEANR